MFEQAARKKLRFESRKGTLSVEELWDLPLTVRGDGESLNTLTMALNKKLKDSGDEDFVNKVSKPNEILQLKFYIAKHIIDVRLEERAAKLTEKSRKEQKQKIMDIIVEKESEALKGQSLDDLRKLLEEL